MQRRRGAYRASDMSTAILDYDAGNLTSVQRALAHLGHQAIVTADPQVVDQAERIIFPGVGAAGSCMASLNTKGLGDAIRRAVARDVMIAIEGI